MAFSHPRFQFVPGKSNNPLPQPNVGKLSTTRHRIESPDGNAQELGGFAVGQVRAVGVHWEPPSLVQRLYLPRYTHLVGMSPATLGHRVAGTWRELLADGKLHDGRTCKGQFLTHATPVILEGTRLQVRIPHRHLHRLVSQDFL